MEDKRAKQLPLILLVGRSGTGKTSIADYIEKQYGLNILQSYTTRPKRHPDEHGHIFISIDEYDRLPDKVATTYFDGNYYCATKEQVDNADIYIIDPDGIKMLKETYLSKTDREYVIFNLRMNKLLRIYRMLKRGDGLLKVLKRIYVDNIKFTSYENYIKKYMCGKHCWYHIQSIKVSDKVSQIASVVVLYYETLCTGLRYIR